MTATTIHPHRPATAPRRGLTTALVALLAVALGLVALPARDALAAGGQPAVSPVLDAGTASRRGSRTPAGPARAVPRPDRHPVRGPRRRRVRPGPAAGLPDQLPLGVLLPRRDSQRLTTGGCSGTKRGNASVRLASRAPSPTAHPSRRADGVRPGAPVRQQRPVRQRHLHRDDPLRCDLVPDGRRGRPGPQQGTTDVGCVPVAPATCDGAWPSRGPWPAASSAGTPPSRPQRPPGTSATPSPRTASSAPPTPLRERRPGELLQHRRHEADDPLRTDLFRSPARSPGRSRSPPQRSPSARRRSASRPRWEVTVRKRGGRDTTPSSVTVTGAAAGDFRVVDSTCPATPLVRDATCLVRVQFSPTALGARTATLTVTHDGLRSPRPCR